jgi:hypothetical protein
MNSNLKYLGFLAILPLLTVMLTIDYFGDANASKSAGTPSQQYGSATKDKVCGDRLCSQTGGKVVMPSPPTSAQPEKKETKPAMEDKMTKSMEQMAPGSVLKLARANVPATIPLHQGWYSGEPVYFIITDSSEQKHADIITKAQGWKVELAPLLAKAPKEALSTTYMFTNGVEGKGVHGFQGEVFTSTPAQADKYSALTAHVHVTWNDGKTSTVLKSEADIKQAEKDGKVILTPVEVVINMPQIMWPGGQMKVKEDKMLTDETAYGDAQVLDINTEKMTVTFVAHRGWGGVEGKTIYYIVTDATPSDPAAMMGVTNSPGNAKLIANAAAVDLFQFMNGIKGTGPMGFQAGIGASAPGDSNYSPMWRIFMIGWKDPSSAQLLETRGDIDFYQKEGKIDVGLARPMDSDHIVNCPFIDPFQ